MNRSSRVAAALVFLELNGISRLPDDDTLYTAMIQIAKKELTKSGLAELFRKHAQSKD